MGDGWRMLKRDETKRIRAEGEERSSQGQQGETLNTGVGFVACE